MSAAEAAVRARERAWLDAYEQPDPVVMADILADGFLITFPNGTRMTKANTVDSAATAAQRPRGGNERPRMSTRNTVALARDGLIILVGEFVQSKIAENGERTEVVSWYTDTWIREGATWRVLASHLSRGPAPAH